LKKLLGYLDILRFPELFLSIFPEMGIPGYFFKKGSFRNCSLGKFQKYLQASLNFERKYKLGLGLEGQWIWGY
jgi:hypothetical protein